MRELFSAEYLRSVLRYDPHTGGFTWISGKNKGKAAGRSSEYIEIWIRGRLYKAHRLAWLWFYGEWPSGELDHIDCNKLNNKISNLRLSTRSQNCANVRRRVDNTTGFKGVDFHKKSGKFRARISVDKRIRHLGYFDTAAEAHGAYSISAAESFEAFARTE